MTHPAETLQNHINHILDLTEQEVFFSLTLEERQSLRKEAEDLARKLTSIEKSFLTMGFLGGTGVGKSTVMNALAGTEIASTSHRRPHTDQVLIYRHVESSSPPPLDLRDVPWREMIHESDSMRQSLLCDLPDFDSLMIEHREHVLRFLEHLDVLVWVTSPEKYADGRFYEFLQSVPKAKQNFFFLLNKVDLLFQSGSVEAGYEHMEKVTKSFQNHIEQNGIRDPLLYLISAKEAMDSGQLSPWNQFRSFRQQVFRQRDVKQVASIKTANLDVEVRRLGASFGKEVLNLKVFDRSLPDCMADLEKVRIEWLQDGGKTIALWLSEDVREDLLSLRESSSILIGPGQGLAILVREWQYRFRETSHGFADSPVTVPLDRMSAFFRRRLEWVEEQLNRRILVQNLPPLFRERLRATLLVERAWDDLKERFSCVVELVVSGLPLPSFWGFKAIQAITYLLLLILLLFAIGDETWWRVTLETPEWNNILRLVLSGIHNLFSPMGLAALGSYALLNVFFVFRFYRRYKKILRRTGQRMKDVMKTGLEKAWEEKLDSVLSDLNQLRTDIQGQISSISDLVEEDEPSKHEGRNMLAS